MAAFSHCSFLLSPSCDQPLLNSTPHHHHTHPSSSNETDTNQSSGMTVNDHDEPPSVPKTHSVAAADTSMLGIAKKKKKNKKENYKNGPSKEGREGRNKKQKKSINGNAVVKQEEKAKITKEPPTGYIHVRARRGEATDSHSLAERVRRERISERMRMLQRLVPGCDKITGKALVLDEIINYVQALQNQVEFLTMKLASVNSNMYGDFTMGQDTLMGAPERLNSDASPLLPPVPQCSINEAPNFADDYSSATFFLQGGRSNNNVFSSLDVVGEFWAGEEDQRKKLPNPCDFNTNLWSFQF
ncbi:hypothetical protein QN277_025719 [Acacia crassicarpa]|uniref:BHLH domain-containing protein n=1 Tax=Acacia crassicarpa TaxID=499986 RepID=A0AAE1K5H6_9FABA|nr:hypothetical protein QN277_025719 [Acacia crassicarpa]